MPEKFESSSSGKGVWPSKGFDYGDPRRHLELTDEERAQFEVFGSKVGEWELPDSLNTEDNKKWLIYKLVKNGYSENVAVVVKNGLKEYEGDELYVTSIFLDGKEYTYSWSKKEQSSFKRALNQIDGNGVLNEGEKSNFDIFMNEKSEGWDLPDGVRDLVGISMLAGKLSKLGFGVDVEVVVTMESFAEESELEMFEATVTVNGISFSGHGLTELEAFREGVNGLRRIRE